MRHSTCPDVRDRFEVPLLCDDLQVWAWQANTKLVQFNHVEDSIEG